jgi:hypothetical protein
MLIVDFDLIFGVERHFQQYFSYAWVRARLCKLQKWVHSTRSRK